MTSSAVQAHPRPGRRERCADCGAFAQRGQLVCLECGTRMALARRAPDWRPAAAVMAAMVLVAGTAFGMVLDAVTGSDDRRQANASPTRKQPAKKAEPAREQGPAKPEPAAIRSSIDRERQIAGAKARLAAAAGPAAWTGAPGTYTVILATVSDREGAERLATDAEESGLEAGVLSAEEHPSLGTGLFFVFSGEYPDQAEAAAAAATLAERFPGANPRQVDPLTASSSAPPEQQQLR